MILPLWMHSKKWPWQRWSGWRYCNGWTDYAVWYDKQSMGASLVVVEAKHNVHLTVLWCKAKIQSDERFWLQGPEGDAKIIFTLQIGRSQPRIKLRIIPRADDTIIPGSPPSPTFQNYFCWKSGGSSYGIRGGSRDRKNRLPYWSNGPLYINK